MKHIQTLILLFFCAFGLNAQTIVTSQAEWNALPMPFFTDVTIQSGTTIVSGGITLIGATLINDGDLTVNGGSAINDPNGMLINNGILTLNAGIGVNAMNMNGTIANYGTITNCCGLGVQPGAVVINVGSYSDNGGGNNSGTINNTGTMTFAGALIGNGFVYNCGTLTDRNGLPPIIGIDGPTPVNTPCDDMDAGTENDVITDANCTCAGTAIAPIPTMGEWGLIVLSLLFFIIGSLALARRRETILS